MRRRLPYRLPRPAPLLLVALVAFVNSAAWALIVPNFQAPDEPSHVAYAVELGETGHPPRSDWNRSFASDEVGALLSGTATYDILQFASVTRPPWTTDRQRAYDRVAATPLRRDNGGGPSTASVHGPVYYAFPALAYRIFYDASFTSRMLAMRLASALLAALTVAFVYLTVRELLPRRPWAPAAAALLVAFQPMFGFMGGVVNADVGVDLAGAALTYLLVRALRRDLTPRLAVAIAAAFLLGVLAKATMLAYLPVLGLGLALLASRRRGRLRDWALMAATGGVLCAIWAVVAHAYHHSFVPTPGGGGSVGTPIGLGGTLSYIWQIFLPPLSFMHHDFLPGIHPVWDIYIVRLWGDFGWLDVPLPHPIFVAIAVVIPLLIALALRGLWLERRALRSRLPEVVLLIAAFVCVSGFVHAAYARIDPNAPILEQGRYLLLAVTPPAVTAMAACLGLGRRLAPVGALTLVSAMMALSLFAQLYVLSAYFT